MAADLTKLFASTVQNNADSLTELSNKIWEHPEIMFEEIQAHEWCAEFLQRRGFKVEKSYLMPTAFRAITENGEGCNIAVLAEYDALPDLGHACGHNLISEAALSAALAIQAGLLSGAIHGKLTVFGTPAEEGGGGKITMIEGGAFQDVDYCLMAHGSHVHEVAVESNAVSFINAEYVGRASHAAVAPWLGINALDAAVSAYNNMSMLRQQIQPTSRVHAIIKDGGVKPNIIPEISKIEAMVRAVNGKEAEALEKRVRACLTSAAEATGCTVKISKPQQTYLNVNHNCTMATVYQKYAENVLKWSFSDEGGVRGGSTDLGNVSYLVPSIHPMFNIRGSSSCEHVIHTAGFAELSNTPEAHTAAQNAGVCLALTAADIYNDIELQKRITSEFRATKS